MGRWNLFGTSRQTSQLLRRFNMPMIPPPMGFLPLVCPSEFLGQIEMREVPDFIGAPEDIRTPDPQIRSLALQLRQNRQCT